MKIEDRLIVAGVRAGLSSEKDDGRSELQKLIGLTLEWNRVIEASWTHGVMPLAYRGLQTVSDVPEHVMERMRGSFHKQGLMIHLQVEELLELAEVFSRRDIPVVAFKGPALAAQAYGHVAIRKPGDLDLLVPKDDFGRARELLKARGYMAHVKEEEEERYLETRGGSAFSRGPFQIDLHWTLEQRRFDSLPFGFQLPTEAVWRDAVDVALQGGVVRTLSPEHHFLFVCFHGAKHYWQKLYLVCDVAALIRSTPAMDWSAVVREARKLRITRIVNLATDLAHEYLRVPVPAELKEVEGGRLPLEKAGDWLFGLRDVDMGCHLFRMAMLESLPDRISYVFNRSWRKISKLSWSG